MKIFAIIVAVAAVIECIEWILRNALALKFWKAQHHLTVDSPGEFSAADSPMVSLVVAAKDEEANIERCLRSLLAQDYPNLEIICVNDRSTDATADIVRKIAAEDSRVSLINIEKLPDGWCGKNHAMQHGIREARGNWIIMTDADCDMISPRTISISMQYTIDEQADMVSIVPTLEMITFWEHLMQPICGGVLMVWYPPAKVNRHDKTHAYANGQFMLISKDAYQAIGTHEAVANSLIEDVDLARKVKKSGRELRMIMSEDLISVRMYSTLGQIMKGWTRIFIGCFPNVFQQLRAFGVLWFKGLTCYITCILGFLMLALGSGGQVWPAVAAWVGLVGSIAETIMMFRFFIHTRGKWWYGLMYWLGCIITGIILLKSIKTHLSKGAIVWRDTNYRAGQHG